MNKFNDQVNFWAHMLDESDHQINESLEEFISPKTNIVCIQCLFRNLLTKNLLNVQTDKINTSNRKGLDFEIYYQVDGNVMKQLLAARLLASNIKDPSPFVNSTQIVDILASQTPIAAFLTDGYGDRITDDVLSPMSEQILKQFNAQRPNVSAFRFSYFNADYDVIWKKLYALAGSNDILKPGSFVSTWKRNDTVSLTVDGKVIPKGEFVELPVYVIGGYWNKIDWNPEMSQFEVNQSQSMKTIIPSVKAKINGKEATAFWNAAKTVDQIDNSKLIGFIELAIDKATESGRDLRSKAAIAPNESEDLEVNEADDIGNEVTAENIYDLVDSNLQKLLTFGDEFYDVEILDDLTMKFVVAGDAEVEVHSVDKYNFDDYGVTRVNSDFEIDLLQKLCENVNELLNANGIAAHYIISKDDAKAAEKSVTDTAIEEYYNTGRTHVRYACDVTFRTQK